MVASKFLFGQGHVNVQGLVLLNGELGRLVLRYLILENKCIYCGIQWRGERPEMRAVNCIIMMSFHVP